MTDDEIRQMLRELLEAIDHDIAKDYDPKTAEIPEDAIHDMIVLVDIVREHLENKLSLEHGAFG
jgi:hypothetical protein